MNTQPLITTGFVTAAVTAALGVVTEFGPDLSDGQQTAILALAAVLAPLVVAGVAWFKVTPSAVVVAVRGESTTRTVAGPASPLPDGTPVAVTTVGPPVG